MSFRNDIGPKQQRLPIEWLRIPLLLSHQELSDMVDIDVSVNGLWCQISILHSTHLCDAVAQIRMPITKLIFPPMVAALKGLLKIVIGLWRTRLTSREFGGGLLNNLQAFSFWAESMSQRLFAVCWTLVARF